MSKITSSDLQSLKNVVEPLGFSVLNESSEDNQKFVVLKKVKNIPNIDFSESILYLEYASDPRGYFTKGKTYRVVERDERLRVCDDTYNGYDHQLTKDYILGNFIPSKREVYVDQLKSEVIRRFPDLKVGSTFSASWIDKASIDNSCKTINSSSWTFVEGVDRLFLSHHGGGGVPVYCNGKFATPVSPKKSIKNNKKSTQKQEINENVEEALEVLFEFFSKELTRYEK